MTSMKLACIPAFNVEKTIGDIVKDCLLHDGDKQHMWEPLADEKTLYPQRWTITLVNVI